jgi:hypothetical protein
VPALKQSVAATAHIPNILLSFIASPFVVWLSLLLSCQTTPNTRCLTVEPLSNAIFIPTLKQPLSWQMDGQPAQMFPYILIAVHFLRASSSADSMVNSTSKNK